MRLYDLELLRYCRDPHCVREYVHEAHGKAARAITAPKIIEVYCAECGTVIVDDAMYCAYCRASNIVTRFVDRAAPPPGVSRDLVDVTHSHVGTYVPTPFAKLHQAVIDDYGATTDRNVQRALRVLINERRVASLASSIIAMSKQRNPRVKPPGWYVRYDSPKLWSPGGLRDLMTVAADKATEGIDLRPGARRRHAVEASL